MSKNNNKGFSLAEVVVAVAIMTLLLSPILLQYMESIRVNRQAKERQYALEDASSIIETIKKTSINDIKSNKGSILDIKPGTSVYTQNDVECELFDKNTGLSVGTVKYNISAFMLDSIDTVDDNAGDIRLVKTDYARTVVIDDLANKVKSLAGEPDAVGNKKRYNISYDPNVDSSTYKSILGADAVKTNESSYVVYDSVAAIDGVTLGAGEFIKYPTKILVESYESTIDYVDPNTIDLGHIQDLDETKVAVVQGSSADYDEKADKDFYNLKLKTLKEVNPEAWLAYMTSDTGENIFSTAKYQDSIRKATQITLDKTADDRYIVSCDVIYEDNYSLPVGTGTNTYTSVMKYRVYYQVFNTDRFPDIYLIYEPYVVNAATATYSNYEYVCVNNKVSFGDVATITDAGKTNEKPNIYVIRPDNTRFTAADMYNSASFPADIKTIAADYYEDVYYTNQYDPVAHSNAWRPVTIYFFRAGNTTTDDIDIYTDIPFHDGTSTEDEYKYRQIMKTDTFPTTLFSESEEADVTDTSVISSNRAGYGDHLHDILDDVRSADGRLYTITVTYGQLDKNGNYVPGYDIRFQSGKGAD